MRKRRPPTEFHAESQRLARRNKEHRRRLRRKLEAEGIAPDEIERRSRALQAAQQQKRDVKNHLRRLEARTDDAYVQPDDRGYRPTQVDPLLTGAARVTGQTAKAVKRGSSVTKWQHDERQEVRGDGP